MILINQRQKLYIFNNTLATPYMWPKWQQICPVCRSHNSILSSFMIYHRVCNRMDVTRGAELLTLRKHLCLPPVLCGVRVARSFFFLYNVCRALFVLLSLFLLVIVSSVLSTCLLRRQMMASCRYGLDMFDCTTCRYGLDMFDCTTCRYGLDMFDCTTLQVLTIQDADVRMYFFTIVKY